MLMAPIAPIASRAIAAIATKRLIFIFYSFLIWCLRKIALITMFILDVHNEVTMK
jgi:hypothetical protein